MKTAQQQSKPAVRMIAVDMDGTLLNSSGKVSPRTLSALNAAHAADVEVVIATGRRHSFAMQTLRSLDLHPSKAVISSNGAVTRTIAADLLHRTLLPLEAARQLCQHLLPYRNALVLTFDKVGPDGDDSRGAMAVERLEELTESIGRWMTANERYIARFDPIELALQQDAPVQAMLCGTIDRMRSAEDLLRNGALAARIAVHRTEYPERDLSIVDILPAGCSKGSSLLRLAAQRGVGAEEIMAIGDNWNDVAMLEVVGRPVVMANAPDRLLETAQNLGWALAEGHDADGAAVAIEAACLARTASEMVG